MERILSVAEMRAADKYTIEKLGIPERTLMARAGEAVAEEIKRRFKGGRILFVCGKGNNGGDGMIAAKLLRNVHGFSVFLLKLRGGGRGKAGLRIRRNRGLHFRHGIDARSRGRDAGSD